MKKSRIDASYECTITIVQDKIADEFRQKSIMLSRIPKDESPFAKWLEPIDCWLAEPSGIYVGLYGKESQANSDMKSNVIILHIYPNVPMWCMAEEIKTLLHRLGVKNPELQSPGYIRSVAQSALRLLEIGDSF